MNVMFPLRNKIYPKKSKGFSLVEVLVTIGIIGVMIVMYSAVLSSIYLSRNVKNKDLALKIANNKIEELRSIGYSSLPTSGSFSDSLLPSLPSGTGAMAISDFNTKTKQVSVTVSWNEQVGGQNSVTLDTLLTQTGGL